MKRFALKLVLFLLLGAILNVAVAWTAVLSQQASSKRIRATADNAAGDVGRSLTRAEQSWYAANDKMIAPMRTLAAGRDGLVRQDPTAVDWTVGFGLRATAFVECWRHRDADILLNWDSTRPINFSGVVEAKSVPAIHVNIGWPCGALGISFWQHNAQRSMIISGDGSWVQAEPDSGLRMPHFLGMFPASDRYALPKEPIWPGFAINTIFYAAILWLPFAALGALRRRRRIKRGLCPKCAYDLRGSDSQVCPECGKAVKV